MNRANTFQNVSKRDWVICKSKCPWLFRTNKCIRPRQIGLRTIFFIWALSPLLWCSPHYDSSSTPTQFCCVYFLFKTSHENPRIFTGEPKKYLYNLYLRPLTATMMVRMLSPLLPRSFAAFKKNLSFECRVKFFILDEVAKCTKKRTKRTKKTKQHYKYFVKLKLSEFLKIIGMAIWSLHKNWLQYMVIGGTQFSQLTVFWLLVDSDIEIAPFEEEYLELILRTLRSVQ